MNALSRIGIARGGPVLLACAAMTFAAGCAAGVYGESEPVGAYPAPVEQDAVVYVDTVPANIEAYPHYYYGDGYAYYVDGRWYHRGPRGWGYYRQEPAPLARQRPYVVQQGVPQAPASAIHYEHYERSDGERRPAAPRQRPDEQAAPPAVSRPSPGVVERQAPSREAPRRAPPANEHERKAPPNEHER